MASIECPVWCHERKEIPNSVMVLSEFYGILDKIVITRVQPCTHKLQTKKCHMKKAYFYFYVDITMDFGPVFFSAVQGRCVK